MTCKSEAVSKTNPYTLYSEELNVSTVTQHQFGGCTNNNIETKNVTVGETVRLKCPRKTCPVLSDSENPTSLDDLNSRCCGSRCVGPFFSFHCRNNVEVDENNLNRSRNSIFSNICSSGDLCCSVGKCEQTWGNCSEPEIEVKIKDGHMISIVLYTLGAAVSGGLIVLFIYLRTEQKNNLCGCCTAAVLSCTTGASGEDTQPTEEEMCYSAAVFTRSKAQPDRGRLKDKQSTLK
eukprot:XP_011619203.1 PREDICTED: uncharacterized protein LOC101070488 [Takifugu rubripes]